MQDVLQRFPTPPPTKEKEKRILRAAEAPKRQPLILVVRSYSMEVRLDLTRLVGLRGELVADESNYFYVPGSTCCLQVRLCIPSQEVTLMQIPACPR